MLDIALARRAVGAARGQNWGVLQTNNFNFTGPLIVLAALAIWLYWALSGKKWFNGPKVQGTKEELMAIERELDALG